MNGNREQVNDRNAEQISRLILAKLKGMLSICQQRELDEWLSARETNRDLFNQLNDPAIREYILLYFLNHDTEKALIKLKSTCSSFAMKKKPLDFWPMHNFKWAVAAVAFCVGSASLFFFIMPNKEQNIVSIVGNKATLTLATGQTILLNTKNDLLIVSDDNLHYKDGSTIAGMSAQDGEKFARENDGELKVSTPAGGQYEMILPDGTKIWLNAASTVVFPRHFSGSERLVKLTGEAYFKVAHNINLPFIVQTQTQRIRVLGTEFNVTSYPDEPSVKTTLVQGTVQINAGQKSLILKPGEQAEFAGKGSLTSHKVSVEEELAWKNNAINFSNKSFSTIMRELARYYDLQVVYEGRVPVVQLFGSVNYGSDVTVVLEVLTASDVKYKLKGRVLTIWE